MSNIYRESKRTVTTQITSLLTTISTRSPLFRQSASVMLPTTERMNNIDRIGINDVEPYVETNPIKYLLHIKTNNIQATIRLVLIKEDGTEIPMEVKGVFIMHGAFTGSFRIETDSQEPVLVSLVYA